MSEQPLGGAPGQRRLHAQVHFVPFDFNPDTGKLTKHGIARRLENQPASALAHLIENRDRLVPREELIALLWPGQDHGDFDHRLDKVIAKLRSALNDNPSKPSFIETYRGRGLRFIASVTLAESAAESAAASVSVAPAHTVHAAEANPAAPQASPLVQSLSAEGTGEPADAQRSWWKSHIFRYAAAVVLGTSLVAGLALRSKLRNRPHAVAAAQPQTALVLSMRASEDGAQDNWIARASTAWLAEDLGDHTQFRTLSAASFGDLLSTLPQPTAAGLPRQYLDAIRARTGADRIVFGTYTMQDHDDVPYWQIDLWVQDTKHPEAIQRSSALGPQTDGPALIRSAQELLCARLGYGPSADTSAGLLDSRLPANPAASRLYAEGVIALEQSDAVEATALFTQVKELEPQHPFTHSLLATAWNETGSQSRATTEYEMTMKSSREMSPRQQEELWALRCKISGDWTTAASVYDQLSREHPADLDYRLQTAWANLKAGQPLSAQRVLSAIPATQATGFREGQLQLAQSLVDDSVGQFDQEFADASRAERSNKASGREDLAARALTQEGAAQFALGHWTIADDKWEQSTRIFERLGDRRGIANVLYQRGRILWARREPGAARHELERSIDLRQDSGNDPDLAAALVSLSSVIFYSNADPNSQTSLVEHLLDRANKIYIQEGNVAGQGIVMGMIGDMYMGQSQYRPALASYTRAIEFSKLANDNSRVANRLLDLGIVTSELGQNDVAERFYSQAMNAYLSLHQRDRAALSQNRLANLLFREDQVDRAIQLSQDALQTMQSIGFVDNGIMEDLSRFEAERDPKRAEYLARESLNASSDAADPRALAGRYTILAEAQLAEGKLSDAEGSVTHAFELKPVVTGRIEGSEMLLVRAEVNRREGNFVKARSDLQRALAICKTYGSKRYEMPVRLALAEVDLQSNQPGARAEMASLEQDSQKFGYLLVTRKAKADLQ